jgi:hypothetical protein
MTTQADLQKQFEAKFPVPEGFERYEYIYTAHPCSYTFGKDAELIRYNAKWEGFQAGAAMPQGEAVAQANEWKDVVIDALVCEWALKAEHETNPRLALADLLNSNATMALDPEISEAAQALVDQGKTGAREQVAKLRKDADRHRAMCALDLDVIFNTTGDMLSGIGWHDGLDAVLLHPPRKDSL